MKKLFIAVLAVAALVACTNEEVVSINQGDAITFDNAFIDNATRAAIDGTYTTNTLGEFEVYATITNPNDEVANIFQQEKVVKGGTGTGDAWTYDANNTQYWIEGNTYDFRAVAEGNVAGATEATVDANGLLTGVNLLDVAAQKDILFAEQMDVTYAGGAQTVKFTFDHLMAKVKFTFKNTVATDNGYTYKVTDVKINETAKNGVYTIGSGWAEAATRENTSLVFGNGAATSDEAGAEATAIAYNSSVESNWERLLVPSNEARNITFTTQLLKDGVVIDTKNRTVDTDLIELKAGAAYNFVISLGNPGEPIKFDVEKVNDWDKNDVIVTVSSAAEFMQALEDGAKVIILGSNITLEESYTRAATDPSVTITEGKELTIDLNGFSLSATSANTGKNYQIFNVYGNLTVKNGAIYTAHTGTDMNWDYCTAVFSTHNNATLNIENAIVQNQGGSAMAYAVDMTNAVNITVNINKSTIESSYIPVRVFNNEKAGKNNITIKDTTLDGKYCFWVQYWAEAGDSHGDYSQLNLDLFNGTNTFEYTGIAPVLFGFNTQLYFDENGEEIVEVSTIEDLIAALESGKEEVTVVAGTYTTFPASSVQAGTTIICQEGVVFKGTSSLNINGATVVGGTFSNPEGTAVSGTVNGTFKNCVFEGEEALRWCYAEEDNPVLFENCVIKTDFRGFHFDDLKGEKCTVTFRECKINGFNAYGGEGTVIFDKCSFGNDESYYNGLNTYANTVLTNCEFTYLSGKSNFIDLEGIGKTMEITNCTATLDGAPADVKNFVGGSKKAQNTVIINGKVQAASQDGLNEAVTEDDAVVELGAGSYTMPNIDNTVTISGDENTVITIDKPNCTGGDVTFEGVTVKGSGYSTGVQHVNTVTYNKATIVGDMCLYGEKVVFNECTFELAKGQYIWTYGADVVEFIGCTFNTAGKAILIYNEGDGANNVKVEGCTFNATAGDKAGAIANQNCAAIEIDNFQSSNVGAGHKLTTSGNTYNSNFSGEWRIKNFVAGSAVTVNGVEYTQIAIDGKLMTIDSNKNVTVQ